MDIFEQIERTRHFGNLFLLWLWYTSAANDTIFYLSDNSSLALAVDSQMLLEAPLSDSERTVLSGGAPAESLEAFEALRNGKILTQAKFRLQRDEKEWTFTLTGSTLAISALKIPALMTKSTDDKLFERQALIEEVDALIRGLYELFLQKRLGPDWKNEQKKITVWIENNAKS